MARSFYLHWLGAFSFVAVLAIDSQLERGLASGALYVAVVALTAWLPGSRSTLTYGVVASAFTLLGFFASPPGSELWKAVTNRLLALLAIWITAALVWHHKRLNARRDQAEARATRSEQQFRATVESSPTGMLLVDHGGKINIANAKAEQLLGYPQGELLGQPIEVLVPELAQSAHVQHRAALRQAQMPRHMGDGREVTGVDKQGRALQLEISLARIVTPDGEFVLATLIDAAERKQLEEARGARELTRQLLANEEAQRKRMAREIHDALGQGLTALKLDIGWLARHLPEEPASLHMRVIEMEELAARTIDDVRRLSSELRPAILDDQGLRAAIRWQVGDFERRSGIPCTVALPDDDVNWGEDRSTAAFRVLQESLTNVVRHAQADNVAVSLWREPQGGCVLEIRDNGRGFTEEQGSRSSALGLRGMRERAQLHGGSLGVVTEPGGGTTVTLRMPCLPQAANGEN